MECAGGSKDDPKQSSQGHICTRAHLSLGEQNYKMFFSKECNVLKQKD